MTSDAAVNAAGRQIARAMDDEKHREAVTIERTKQRHAEQITDDAARKQARPAPGRAPLSR